MPYGGVWFLPSPSGEGSLILGAHTEEACGGRSCALHGPSDHWARDMPLRWVHPGGETDGPATRRGRMERLCPHGVWHDDPDDLAFRKDRGMDRHLAGILPAECDCPCDCEHEPPF